ncbi:FAD-dependent monooxygenase [Oceanobacter sp. 3_MG-2023]|uniref:FAD-dependent monooxygenase n=1 Tax=Oceanobacter sp. 3_MG-2023 TaxID=3062622 RepID=UPI0027354924|nr:FAD-dependent monooxygenase [Oceanobacter sp. 3_MG-2023]MDP2504964.1 FAD-dependent monooxygenase [Oceanobacter sp. 3_MG-2023]
MEKLSIGVVGGGIGGLTAAIALQRMGHRVTVYEQSKAYARIGADINLTPNAVKALDGLGLNDAIRKTAARPTHRISRMWDSGKETSRLAMSNEAELKYGAPQLTIHRADLLVALADAFDIQNVVFNARIDQITELPGTGVRVTTTSGRCDELDVVIGADGIHSAVRAYLFGAEQPRFTGVVAYRAVVPAEQLQDLPDIQAFTKWWGETPESQIVTFPLNQGKDIFIFATTAQDSWTEESWTGAGDCDELRSHYTHFHPQARALLDRCDDVLKTALYERDPLQYWSKGRIALLGDACHPMMPFMAQGAGQAIEDAIVLARALEHASNGDEAAAALHLYQAVRQDRARQIQIGSRSNQWLKNAGSADWVYGYDAWTVPLQGTAEEVTA